MVIKLGTSQVSVAGLSIAGQFIKYFTNLSILGGIALYALSAVIWVFALSRVQLSVAYPMVAGGYILVVIFSYLLLHEPVSLLKVVGLVTIALGVIIIANS